MRKKIFGIITLLCALIQLNVHAQNQKFMGMLEYKITARDSTMQQLTPENRMILYTNDTIVRTENFTRQLGKQVIIRHIEKNKSYLLLDTPFGKYAIQTDLNVKDTVDTVSKYSFKKKCFKRKILGMKANRLIVEHPDFESPIEFLYLKKFPAKYNNVFPTVPGLLVQYSIATADGVLDYSLTKMSEYVPNRDLFGIPSDYERVSFDEFLEKMIEAKNKSSEVPE